MSDDLITIPAAPNPESEAPVVTPVPVSAPTPVPTPAPAPIATILPFRMQPAPRKQRVSEPIDLGKYDADYAGWLAVFDLDVGLDANELVVTAQDTDASVPDRLRALSAWVARVLIAWNFVDSNGDLLPQPREGGAVFCPQLALPALTQAFGEAIAPKAK